MRTKYRRVLLAVFWLALAYLAFEGVKKLGEVTDFSVYYRAADAVRNGSSAYESEIPGRPTLPYVYPPVLSSLLLPLTFLGEATAQGIWTRARRQRTGGGRAVNAVAPQISKAASVIPGRCFTPMPPANPNSAAVP